MKVNGKFAALAGAALLLGSSVAFAQPTDDYELPEGFTFTNKISTDIIKAKNQSSDEKADDDAAWKSEFAGIVEQIKVAYNSEKLAFELGPKVKFGEIGAQNGRNAAKVETDDTAIFYDGMDWTFRWSPFDIVDIYLKNDVRITGSQLPIADRGVSSADAGKLGSDGLTIVVKPIEGLRLAASAPFSFDVVSKGDFLNGEITDNTARLTNNSGDKTGAVKFNLGLGADYTFNDMFNVGLSWKDILDAESTQLGLYFDLIAIKNLDVRAGYTFTKQSDVGGFEFDEAFNGLQGEGDAFAWNSIYKIYGQHRANLSGTFKLSDLTIGAEAVFNVMSNQSLYDIYGALKVGYDIVPGKVNIGLAAYVAADMGTTFDIADDDDAWEQSFKKKTTSATKSFEADVVGKRSEYATVAYSDEPESDSFTAAPVIGIKPEITYTSGKHTFGAAAAIDFVLNDRTTEYFKFPVYWQYNF